MRVRRPRLQSTVARAVVPVAGGLAFFAILAAALWGVAALISHNGKQASANLAPPTQEMGSTKLLADIIDKQGPIVMQDLVGTDTHIVLVHTGTDPGQGWALYLAHPSHKPATCTVSVERSNKVLVDCDGRTVTTEQLATVPQGVGPIVSNDGTFLTLALRPTVTPSQG